MVYAVTFHSIIMLKINSYKSVFYLMLYLYFASDRSRPFRVNVTKVCLYLKQKKVCRRVINHHRMFQFLVSVFVSYLERAEFCSFRVRIACDNAIKNRFVFPFFTCVVSEMDIFFFE